MIAAAGAWVPLLFGLILGIRNHEPAAPLVGGAITVGLLLMLWLADRGPGETY